MFTEKRINLEISWFNSYCCMHQSSADGGARLNGQISWLHHVVVSYQLMVEDGSSIRSADRSDGMMEAELCWKCKGSALRSADVDVNPWSVRIEGRLNPLISWSSDQLIPATLMPAAEHYSADGDALPAGKMVYTVQVYSQSNEEGVDVRGVPMVSVQMETPLGSSLKVTPKGCMLPLPFL